MSRSRYCVAIALLLCLVIWGGRAGADRIVLAPRGLITSPGSVAFEYATLASGGRTHLAWINLGVPSQQLGLELEAEQYDWGGPQRATFSAQYSLTGNAFSDLAPAVSVGVRDVLNRGPEGRALFLAATKTLGLSRSQEHVVRDWKLDLGYGTSRLDGPYIGLQGRFTLGLLANVEYVARNVNASLALPVGRHLRLNVYTLRGDTFYGASFVLFK